MKFIRILCASISAVLLLSAPVFGEAEVSEDVRNNILKAFPNVSAELISPAPIPGLYQIMLGGQVSYVSADGRYLIQGDIYDVVDELNLTEKQRETARQAAVEQIGENQMIVFRPEEAKYSITVFTDIDCGYCRKLHRQIAAYNDLGIEVRYMFFPRSGPDTESWYKAENVWCADDRNAALTMAKSGVNVESPKCSPTPVSQHYNLGRAIGIRGTPAIVAQGGELIPGYVSPEELIKYLEE